MAMNISPKIEQDLDKKPVDVLQPAESSAKVTVDAPDSTEHTTQDKTTAQKWTTNPVEGKEVKGLQIKVYKWPDGTSNCQDAQQLQPQCSSLLPSDLDLLEMNFSCNQHPDAYSRWKNCQ